jgi:DNA-binding beta-propeller fold protein YncE
MACVTATDGTEGNPMTIAINPLTGRVYIAGSNVEVIDQKSDEIIDTISVGSGQLNGIAVDPVLRRAYVRDYADGLFAIGLTSNTVVSKNPCSNVNGVGINPVTAHAGENSFIGGFYNITTISSAVRAKGDVNLHGIAGIPIDNCLRVSAQST